MDNYLYKKLLYQSKNRGCKETDILLGKFSDHCLHEMSVSELKEYEIILEQCDADIVDIVVGGKEVPENLQLSVIYKLIEFHGG